VQVFIQGNIGINLGSKSGLEVSFKSANYLKRGLKVGIPYVNLASKLSRIVY